MQSPQELFKAARAIDAVGDGEDAARLYEEIVALHPDYAPALFALGATMNRRGVSAGGGPPRTRPDVPVGRRRHP